MRHAHLLGAKDPLMHRLVPTLVEEMGAAYSELGRAQANIESVFEQEEIRFRRTLGRGTALLEDAVKDMSKGDKLDGRTAFTLYDTYGFPLDLTQDALRAKGIDVDTDGFDTAMEEQREQSKADGGKFANAGADDLFKEVLETSGATTFTGYDHLSDGQGIVALIQNDIAVDEAVDGDVVFITRETPFYAESGGQAGCGGTHVERTGDIALFKITGEGAVAAGIRRVEAVSGEAARQYLENQAGLARQAADLFKTKLEDVPSRIEALLAERKQLEKDLSEAKKQLALGGGGAASGPEDINGISFLGRVLDGVSGKDLRSMLNEQIDQLGSGIVAFVARDGGKVAVAVAVSDDVQATHSASDLVNVGAAKVGGRGGGKPGMAQAGGSQPENAEAALDAIKAAVIG